MSSLSMCRVCLVSDVRMHVIIDTPLAGILQKISNISLARDGKPLLVCYICHTQVKKCQALVDKVLKADALLNQLIHSGVEVSPSVVTPHREAFSLTDGLCLSPVECIATIAGDPDTKTDLPIKDELKTEHIEDTPIKRSPVESDTNHSDAEVLDAPSQSDSDDNIPLKNISLRNRKTVRKRGSESRKKTERGFTADFAREIILSKEQQLAQLLERANSLNYLNSPFKCSLCYKGFVDARAFDNHREKHDERSGPHECDVCRMRYRTTRQLRTHAATSHARQYACAACPHVSHTANQAREHEKWHSGHTYECKLCGQKFRKPTSYLTHMRKRHPTKHVCRTCGDSFVGRHGLLMHKSKAHGTDKPAEPPAEPEPASERYCGECHIQFESVAAWQRHELNSPQHTLRDENTLQCGVCGARLPGVSALREHRRRHARPANTPHTHTPYAPAALLPCDQCGAKFATRSKLQAHVKRVHLGLKYNKNIVCELCGKKCTSNASLKYHQRTHTGEKPFSCVACGKRFADNNQLRIHTRTHTGERPYCCAACGKRFSQKPALNRHYRVHTGAKPYPCQFCSKPFSQSNSLKLHVRTVHLRMRRAHPEGAAAQGGPETTQGANAGEVAAPAIV